MNLTPKQRAALAAIVGSPGKSGRFWKPWHHHRTLTALEDKGLASGTPTPSSSHSFNAMTLQWRPTEHGRRVHEEHEKGKPNV